MGDDEPFRMADDIIAHRENIHTRSIAGKDAVLPAALVEQGIDLPLYGRRGKYLTIPYINYVPLLVAVVQSQQKEIDRLKRLIG